MACFRGNTVRWTFAIEVYKRGWDWKGINTGQNGVRMIAGSLCAAFWVECKRLYTPVCTHMPLEPAKLLFHSDTKPFIMFPDQLINCHDIKSNNALCIVADLNGPITGQERCSVFMSQSEHSWGFGLESRSGVDEIRAEQTHIKHQPPQTHAHMHTFEQTHKVSKARCRKRGENVGKTKVQDRRVRKGRRKKSREVREGGNPTVSSDK